jgi:uncharacterized protein (UPF0276 family)
MSERFGLLYDAAFGHELADRHQELDLLEIIPDRYFDAGLDPIFSLPATLTKVFHSLNFSLGSDEPLDEFYMGQISTLATRLKPIWASDHLAVTRIDGTDIGNLSPIRWSSGAVAKIAGKIQKLQDRLKLPFLIENIAYYFRIPGAEFGEAELLDRLVQATGCSLLLDLNNVVVNAANHGFDPHAYLEDFPLHAVQEIHVAGHRKRGQLHLDSHGEPVGESVWELLRFVAARVGSVNIILERDQDIPPFDELVGELAIARRCVREGMRV